MNSTPNLPGLAERFAFIDAHTRKGIRIAAALPTELKKTLWGEDAAGDLYIALCGLVADVGPMTVGTYATFFNMFPDNWWSLESAVVRAICVAIEGAHDATHLQAVKQRVAKIGAWIVGDRPPVKDDRLLTLERLADLARQWSLGDEGEILDSDAEWVSVLAPRRYSYYVTNPVTTARQLANVGRAVSRDLLSRAILEAAVRGEARVFAISEALRPRAEPVAALLIEKHAGKWVPGKVFSRDPEGTRQSLARLTAAIATHYAACEAAMGARERGRKAAERIAKLVEVAFVPATTSAGPASVRAQPELRDVMLPDTSSLCRRPERAGIGRLVAASTAQVVIVAAVIEELEGLKTKKPELSREIAAALRMIEGWMTDGRAVVNGLTIGRRKLYGDEAILEHARELADAGRRVTIITSDTGLRIRARACLPMPSVMCVDARSLVDVHRHVAAETLNARTDGGEDRWRVCERSVA